MENEKPSSERDPTQTLVHDVEPCRTTYVTPETRFYSAQPRRRRCPWHPSGFVPIPRTSREPCFHLSAASLVSLSDEIWNGHLCDPHSEISRAMLCRLAARHLGALPHNIGLVIGGPFPDDFYVITACVSTANQRRRALRIVFTEWSYNTQMQLLASRIRAQGGHRFVPPACAD